MRNLNNRLKKIIDQLPKPPLPPMQFIYCHHSDDPQPKSSKAVMVMSMPDSCDLMEFQKTWESLIAQGK